MNASSEPRQSSLQPAGEQDHSSGAESQSSTRRVGKLQKKDIKFRKGIEDHCTISVINAGHQVLHEKHVEEILAALLH